MNAVDWIAILFAATVCAALLSSLALSAFSPELVGADSGKRIENIISAVLAIVSLIVGARLQNVHSKEKAAGARDPSGKANQRDNGTAAAKDEDAAKDLPPDPET